MDKNYSVKVTIGEEGLKEYLSQFYSEEEIEEMNLDNEAVDCVDSLLQDNLSDFYVSGKNTLTITF